MTKQNVNRRTLAVAAGVLLTLGVLVGWVIADAHQSGWRTALLGATIIAGYAGVILLLRRGDGEAGLLLSGSPTDERQEVISRNAGNVTGVVACVASALGYAISALDGAHGQAQAFGLMASICGGTLIVSTLVLSRRS